ncbi:hypothetical protein BpHYR1_039180 [Brachionus plicatilis]|uniref:Uncharacterized protein n=1 Tax=Brachionus plicatilis TaxID=10195 RepID=A0A3M7QPC3_BRAPC|nr:hypothetical protein BpHYR1_039180 [Brachionus plicatilis]
MRFLLFLSLALIALSHLTVEAFSPRDIHMGKVLNQAMIILIDSQKHLKENQLNTESPVDLNTRTDTVLLKKLYINHFNMIKMIEN